MEIVQEWILAHVSSDIGVENSVIFQCVLELQQQIHLFVAGMVNVHPQIIVNVRAQILNHQSVFQQKFANYQYQSQFLRIH